MAPVLTPEQTRELAALLTGHAYTVDAVVGLVGEPAHRALGRNSTVAAVRQIGDRDDPLATLTSLWPLQQPVPRRALDRALPGLVGPLTDAGILISDPTGQTVRAAVDIRPYASDSGTGQNWWVVSDPTPGLDQPSAPMRPDFVLGVSSASSTLAQLTLREPVRRALDLGTGCGVQSLHLAAHAQHVTATDLNPRALTLARLTAALNGVEVDFRLGDLYAPVAGEEFDLITSNPPYVMAPPSTQRLVYREGAAAGDGLVEHVVRQGASQLADGGVLQVLGNWAHLHGVGWADRWSDWLAGSGCDAHIVQREVLDPFEYVELWLADAGLAGSPTYRDRYAEWLDYFARLGIEAVGLGWVTLRKTGARDTETIIEDWPFGVEQPIARALTAELAAVDRLRDLDVEQRLQRRWRLADDVVEETQGEPGAGDPHHIVLRQQRGFRRAMTVDTELAAILGACDGELSLAQIVESVAQLLETDPDALRDRTLGRLFDVVVQGYLH